MLKLNFSKCPILGTLPKEAVESLFYNIEYKVSNYDKGDLIATQGSACNHLYILLEGIVKTEMSNNNGTILSIETIEAVKPLASAFLFAEKNRFPVDVTSLTPCSILTIPKEEVFKMFQKDQTFLENYIKYTSNKTNFLSMRLQSLNIKTIKGKLAHYILNELERGDGKGTEPIFINMDMNQTELARYFGVTRPSLARIISELENDNVIEYNKKYIKVIDLSALNELINEDR